jgi:hypothetical protein
MMYVGMAASRRLYRRARRQRQDGAATTRHAGFVNGMQKNSRPQSVVAEKRMGPRRRVPMRDWIADWNKWSPTERILAVAIAVTLMAVPLSLLLSGRSGV